MALVAVLAIAARFDFQVEQAAPGAAMAAAPQGISPPLAVPAIAEPKPPAASDTAPAADHILQMALTLGGLRPAPSPAGPVGVVLFDPRCPYCHAAWSAPETQAIDLLWVPVPALGDEPPDRSRVATVLAAAGQDGEAAKANLAAAFGPSPPVSTLTPELAAKADENQAVLILLRQTYPAEVEGVPTWLVRGTDGHARIASGWPAPDGLFAGL